MLSKYTTWILIAALACQAPLCAGEAPEAIDDYEPPPEGFEERRYALDVLTTNRRSLDDSGPVMGFDISGMQSSLRSEDVIAILKHAAAPDSWTRRGPARIGTEGATLVVLQKKEVHDEIAKVLQWLRDGFSTPARMTVALVALKPEQLAKIQSGSGAVPTAEFAKLLEDAGENAALLSDLRGAEGLYICSTGTFRQHVLADLDVSGAIFDPVIRATVQGLTARALTVRCPDGNSARVDLRLSWSGPAALENTPLRVRGTSVQNVRTTLRAKTADEKNRDPEKKDEPAPERVPGETRGVDFNAVLNIESNRQPVAEIRSTLIAPRGQFVLVGVIDLSLLGDGKTPDRRAVFVRAEVGAAGAPALQGGLGGLKEGEIFKLYPLAASEQHPSFPPPHWYGEPPHALTVDLGASQSSLPVANPFSFEPTAAIALTGVNVQKFQSQFSERVRKNKLIEAYGKTLFTRLSADDHAKLNASLMLPLRQHLSGVRVRAVALALSQAEYRKLLIDEPAKIDDAALAALQAGAGAATLADSSLVVQPLQRTYVFGGQLHRSITDLDVSGDNYDPTLGTIMERGYVLGAEYLRQQAPGLADITVDLSVYPGGTKLDKTPFESYALANGAEGNVALGVSTELTRARMAILNLHGAVNGTKGQFHIAASVPMTPGADGKPDPRQVLLFVRADDSTQP